MKNNNAPQKPPKQYHCLVCIGNGNIEFFDGLLPQKRIDSEDDYFQPVEKDKSPGHEFLPGGELRRDRRERKNHDDKLQIQDILHLDLFLHKMKYTS